MLTSPRELDPPKDGAIMLELTRPSAVAYDVLLCYVREDLLRSLLIDAEAAPVVEVVVVVCCSLC